MTLWEAGGVALQVEVFPQEPYRWIADIDAPSGPFSTETTAAADVPHEVEASIKAVLGLTQPAFELVDDLGDPWSPLDAPAQVQRLDIVFDEGTWLPARRNWWQRLFARRSGWPSGCPACDHDWREHNDSSQECAECRRAIEQQKSSAPTTTCRLMPSAEVRCARPVPHEGRVTGDVVRQVGDAFGLAVLATVRAQRVLKPLIPVGGARPYSAVLLSQSWPS